MSDTISLLDALGRFMSVTTIKDRNEAIEDYKYVLNYNNRSRLTDLKDKSFAEVFSRLGREVITLRSTWLTAAPSKSKNPTNNSNAKARSGMALTQYATVMRLTVEVALRTMRVKTLRLVLDHILQTLPSAESEYCEPIALDYVRCLRIILEYQPHVEHLTRKEWNTIVEFCTEGVLAVSPTSQPANGLNSNGTPRFQTPDTSAESTTRSFAPESGSSQHHNTGSHALADDLVGCLRHLASATNAPLMDQAVPLVSTLTEWLRLPRSPAIAHVDAFATMNAILSRTYLDSVSCTQQAIRDLVPVMKTFWSTKLGHLKDEMLITLIFSRAHIHRMLHEKGTDIEDLRIGLENLIEAMQIEYVKRVARDQLQIEDLRLRCGNEYPYNDTPFSLPCFRLKPGNVRSEHSWTLLYFVADLAGALESSRSRVKQVSEYSDIETPSKKRRASDYLQDYLRQLSNPNPSTKLFALHVISFMVQQIRLTTQDVHLLLEKLISRLSDGNPAISNWAMLGTASCAVQTASYSPELKGLWTTVWQLSSRNVTTSSTCRAAAHVMDVTLRMGLVDFQAIAEIVDSMISSADLHGPAILSESSCSLWLTVFDVRNSESPHGTHVTIDRMLRWLFSRWTPSNFYERAHATQKSHHYDAWDIIRMLSISADRSPPPHVGIPFSYLGPLALATLRAKQCPQLLDYLLLTPPEKDFLVAPRVVVGSTSVAQQSQSTPTDNLILSFCTSEMESASKQFKELARERAQGLSSDMIRIVTILCVVSYQLSRIQTGTVSERADGLHRMADALARELAKLLSRPECDQLQVDAAIEAIAPCLPKVSALTSLGSDLFDALGISSLVWFISGALEERNKSKDGMDLMEADEEFDSQTSNRITKGEAVDIPRDELSALMNINAMRTTITATLQLLASAVQRETDDLEDSRASNPSDTRVPQAFKNYMSSLSAKDFLLCKRLLLEILTSSLQLTAEDGGELLTSATDKFLQHYEHERSEAAMGICVDLMSGTAVAWTDRTSSTYDLGADLYEWLIKKPLKAGAASPAVQIKVANLFQKLLQIQPEYAADLHLPSVRTSLFSLLQDGGILLKFHIIDCLSELFGLFVLSRHDAVFEDVHASLPSDQDSMEEMALRLLGFARLGAAWHTLLRRSVYHIFEAAGLIKRTAGHAASCIQTIARSLDLDSSQLVFRLFASQLLYTWIDADQKIEDIPYSIFGYESLALLLEDLQEEVHGQLAMRKNTEEIPVLLKALNVSHKDLAQRNFSKAAAYAIAWDQCRNRGNTPPSHERALRELLGDSIYKALLAQQFPCVLAVLISTMEDVDLVGNSIHKFPEFQKVGDGLEAMRKISSSDISLPADQQPSFQAKHIFDEIKRLCRRTGYDHANFWTPDCFVFVMRYLLDKIHPALGSLHACSGIRKIRFLVALAGPIAFESYPLQMTLGSLRPFLTDAQCADDTLGIVRHLLHHGRPQLMDQLSFVAGNSISILISLRIFLSSSQDSTTQETQHRATMQKAQDFDKWFSDYLESYVKELLSFTTSRSTRASLELFQSMVRAARDVRTAGNAMKGSPESNLLMALLRDEASEKRLLNGPSQTLAYSLLCREFNLPPSFREDLLGEASLAAKFATQVWKSSQRSNNSKQYLLWAARVLGRGYSATGEIQESLRKAAREGNGANLRSRKSRTSRMLIVENIAAAIQGDEPRKAGLAEQILREVLSEKDNEQAVDREHLEEIKQVLSVALVHGLTMNGAFKIPLFQPSANKSIEETAYPQRRKELASWISDLCISLAKSTVQDRVVNALPKCLAEISSLSEELFPYILHLALERDLDSDSRIKQAISDAYRKWFQQDNDDDDDDDVPYLKILLRSILYLRTQHIPRERNIADRIQWLDIDYLDAANAAVKCGMHRAALLLAETHASQPVKSPRRSSVLPQQSIPLQLQLSIYKNLDEPDSFYGAEQEPSLESVLNRLDYEADGFKGLLFHSAKMDSEMRRFKTISSSDSSGIVRDLTMLNLNSLTHAISTNDEFRNTGNNLNHNLEVAQKLEQWDIRAPPAKKCEAAAVYKAFQGMSYSTDLSTVRKHIDQSLLDTIETCTGPNISTKTLQSSLRTFSVLNEIDEMMTAQTTEELFDTWFSVKQRAGWMKEARMEDIRPVLSARETLFSMLSKSPSLQAILHTGPRQLREREADAHISASEIYRKHGAVQELLASATYLADLVPTCRDVGYSLENVAKYQVSLVLWDQGEKNTSIRMLQQLESETKSKQDSTVARSVLLTKLGQYTAEARLKKPEEIMKQYMEPAIRELKSNKKGALAGQTYHAFAHFCDQQLQSPDLIEDQNRMRLLAERKEADAVEYEKLAAANRSNKNAREWYKQQARKARKWFNMDMQEAQKLGDSRVAFLRQSLENYLLALQACDEHDDDVFRMCSLWLEYSHLPLANNAVSKYIQPVPSGKFVVLMNQLSSRLQDEDSDFQHILSELVFRICRDHPYHGMNHIYAGSNNDKSKDQTARSRNAAAKIIGKRLKNDKVSHDMWDRITKANSVYNDLAMYVDQSMFRMGKDYEMRRYPYSKKLIATIPDLKVPPITMPIPVSSSGNYHDVPKVSSFKSTMSIANGISQPKVVTAYTTNGRSYKQLYKSGNDDLRQDAIMEQVFEHVSLLLRNHTATRLRNLNIRTYRVVPLSHRSGVIEFVQNTMPLMNYLDGAHKTYYPKDLDQSQCRKKIADIQTHNHEERVKVYREVCRNFNPVLRFFFLERFEDPDDWFEKRLAYTRSTAAISILGHVLGLGDRHCHNILLDQQSGEAVHIDLGVAFEAGRVLPVPEVVPFRLTRDVVDAMGHSGVEGVFRRCCEFTLDTLRGERDSIMTILNVLRYDPLYSWSVSPLKAKKMQEAAQNEAEGKGGEAGGGAAGGSTVPDNDPSGVGDDQEQRFLLELPSKRKEDEEVQGEAGRALSVVERKLSKALSSAAAVAELIQQATDERNLAVLYAGWSAWC